MAVAVASAPEWRARLHQLLGVTQRLSGPSAALLLTRVMAEAVKEGHAAGAKEACTGDDVQQPQEDTDTPHQTQEPDAAAWLARTVDLACQTASQAILDDETSALERAQLDHVLGTLYYVNQAVRTTLLCDRLLSVGAPRTEEEARARSGADQGGAKKKAGGGKKGGGRGGGSGGGDHDADALGVRDEDLAAGIARFTRMDTEDMNHMQQLLLYLLNSAQARGYRRLGEWLYKRIEVPGGHDTHAWQPAQLIREFVYESTRKEVNFEMWLHMTSMRTNVGSAVEHLANCHDVQLPDLVRDRHTFAFRDGIYLAAEDRFVRYGTPEHHMLPSDLVAARFFNLPLGALERATDTDGNGRVDGEGEAEVTEGDGWRDIPTPHMQSILDYQDMGADVARWMYVFIGRLLYEVGERDNWQVVPYLKGAASSGKSTLLTRVCRGFYNPEDVGVLSNNIEVKFGLSALYDKLLIIGPEIKSDIKLEQAEFQSMVSGETVQVAIKCQTARTVDWTAPMILAGNQVPGWVDNAGSINRRIVLFDFPRMVVDGDMNLGKKLEAELPAILLKANRAYLEAVHLYSRGNVWKHLPEAFHETKREFAQDTNSLVAFLESGGLQFGKDLVIPHMVFKRLYLDYCEANDIKGKDKQQPTKILLSVPLAQRSCRYVSKRTFMYRGQTMCDAYIVGCDMVDTTATGAAAAVDMGGAVDEGDDALEPAAPPRRDGPFF